MLQVCVALSNGVFCFYNCRKVTKSFAGDVGSISTAYILLFLTATCIQATANPIFLLLFIVYVVDVIITIIHRIAKKELIFEAHRQHLFQYLANEIRMPHLLVSGIYAFIQFVITVGVMIIWEKIFYPR